LLGDLERTRVLECLESGWISSEGPMVAEFEAAFARETGRRYGIAVCNGSAALEAAVAALQLGPGDEVILPSFTIISCATAIVRSGATPVVVDCEPASWTMNVGEVAERITPRTRAIMPVHIYGLPVDMTPLLALAKQHGIRIIEDAAEAHGLVCDGRPCGSFGDLSVFSFYPNKHVTTGEGGMIVTDDAHLAERGRSLRNLCFQSGRRFVHEELGWNLRMTSLQAALGLAQLERLPAARARKLALGALYRELLGDLPELELAPQRLPRSDNGYWVFGVVLKESARIDAQEAMRRLADAGIGTRPFFWPMHEQPVFQRMGLFANQRLPVSERIARRGFYLPSGIGTTDDQIRRSAAALRAILA
jgi:perosamine synthetase